MEQEGGVVKGDGGAVEGETEGGTVYVAGRVTEIGEVLHFPVVFSDYECPFLRVIYPKVLVGLSRALLKFPLERTVRTAGTAGAACL